MAIDTRWIRLIAVAASVSAIWLVILPQLSDEPKVIEHGRWLRESGIDPAAMIYSDHPASERIVAEVAALRRSTGAALWAPFHSNQRRDSKN